MLYNAQKLCLIKVLKKGVPKNIMSGTMIGYARCSRDSQDLQVQIETLKKLGIAERYIYTDKASTQLPIQKREGWQQCYKALREGDTLVCVSLSRLGRDVRELKEVVSLLLDNKINVKFLDFDVEFNTSTGRFMFHMLCAVYEMERDIIRERTKAALALKKEQGVRIGRPSILSDEVLVDKICYQHRIMRESKRKIAADNKISRNSVIKVLQLVRKYEKEPPTF